MVKSNKILVAIDGSKNSDRGLVKAIDIAQSRGSTIIGLNVINVPTSYFLHKSEIKIRAESLKNSEKILDGAKKKCIKANVDFESKVIPGGEPGYDIVKYAKKNNVNLIVIGARGLNPLKEIFLGSTSNYVLHKSKIPVMIVK